MEQTHSRDNFLLVASHSEEVCPLALLVVICGGVLGHGVLLDGDLVLLLAVPGQHEGAGVAEGGGGLKPGTHHRTEVVSRAVSW